MSPSRPFILRPVATSLLMAAILLVGFVAFRFLPLSALPEVDYPIIQVSTFSWCILFYFIYSFIDLYLSLKKSNEKERDVQMRSSQYIDPIENFSNEIDQLSDTLNRT